MNGLTEISVCRISVNEALAQRLVDAAHEAARARSVAVAVAVTDAAGHLRAFRAADAVGFLSIEIAIDKAWTVSSFGLPTHVWNELITDPAVAPIGARARVVPVGGGLPVVVNGQVLGGIGVSGGTAEEDRQIAEAALQALGLSS